MVDIPMPVIAECSSNFALVSIGRTYSANFVGGIRSSGIAVGASSSAAGLNTGSQTSSRCWNSTSTG